MDKTYPYFMPFVQNITFHYTRFFILKKYIQFMKTKEKIMKKVTFMAIAFTLFFGVQLLYQMNLKLKLGAQQIFMEIHVV